MPRSYSRDFKLGLCRKIRSGELTQARACRDEGLSSGMLGRWLTQFDVHGEDAFRGQPWREQTLSPERRLALLQKELEQTKLENEFLRWVIDQKKSEPGSGFGS
jgi:transposase-like protein